MYFGQPEARMRDTGPRMRQETGGVEGQFAVDVDTGHLSRRREAMWSHVPDQLSRHRDLPAPDVEAPTEARPPDQWARRSASRIGRCMRICPRIVDISHRSFWTRRTAGVLPVPSYGVGGSPRVGRVNITEHGAWRAR